MQIRLDKNLQKELEEINKKDPEFSNKIKKQLTIFALNPRHKSLRVHKLIGELDNMWSISITKSVRMTYLQNGDEAYFFDIDTHDDVYRKK